MIYILTVYDSLNYGSYLQAISLKSVLEKYGKVAFLDIHHQSTLKQTLKKVCGHIYRRRFPGVGFEIKRYKIFNGLKKELPIVDIKSAEDNNIYVFGSDEIWNINREKFLNSPEFFGIGLKKGIKIAYAPTVNTVKPQDFTKYNQLVDGIRSFDSISVRDSYSCNVLSQLIDNQIETVVDPTFLYGVENFRKLQIDPQNKQKYVMIYTYNRMFKNQQQAEAVRKACKDRGLRIISVGKYLKWCDESVMATPAEFLGYVANAECVITDTFHGTVFTMLYRKKLIEVNPAQKIKDLLKDFGLESRVVADATEVGSIFDIDTDYSKADINQDIFVKKSFAYLDNALSKAISIKENSDK